MAGESVISLPLGSGTGDPNRPTVEEALDTLNDAASASYITAEDKLRRMAGMEGDISNQFSTEELSKIGETCVSDYERDKRDRKDWEEVAREALDACSQEQQEKAKDYPWAGASNMRWPLLTIAAMQFNARMYPAVIKGDEAVLCKVIGSDKGKPAVAQNPRTGEVQPVPAVDPSSGDFALDANGMPQPHWIIPPGAKSKRASRVSQYMNAVLFYRMQNWEDDTDALLMQLPAVGTVFRKLWADSVGQQNSATISALNLVVPVTARNLMTTPRITEEIENIYPHEIETKMRSGYYRAVDLGLPKERQGSEDKDGARLLLEQHCLWDFDEDGLPEPYIVTLDHQTRQVLRIEPNFAPDSITWHETPDGNEPVCIARKQFYVKYGMFPNPKGAFYDLGLGHLLKRLNDVINTAINQLLDAGHAQTAGGGFIGSGVRLQARGQGGTVRFAPGEYKTVDVTGDELRAAIFERTLPNVSPVTFQVLDLVLGAARDIAGIKDVMTGEASNTGQVGTTLALIEQGLQVFNAAAKRIFRSFKAEFELLFENIGQYGGAYAAKDYATLLDDPEADFAQDFAADDMDIRTVSDPASITRMQKMARAQFLLGIAPGLQAVGGDIREVYRRALEAIDMEDIDKVLPEPKPADPQQIMLQMKQLVLQMEALQAKSNKDNAAAQKSLADADKAKAAALKTAAEAAGVNMETHEKAVKFGAEMGALTALTNGGA